MQMILLYSLALLLFSARLSIALPADSSAPWPFDHPYFDPPPESIECHDLDDPPYVPLFPNGLDHDQEQDYPNDYQEGATSSVDRAWSQQQIEEQIPSLQIDETDIDTRWKRTVAKRNFSRATREMGSPLWNQSLWKRYKEYATANLIPELESNDENRIKRATRTILLQRIPQKSRYTEETTAYLPTTPIYLQHTKEDILHRLYEVMDIAPVEDIKHMWLDRICKQAEWGGSAFVKLYSNNRKDQIAAIRILVGLSPHGDLWIRETKKQRLSIYFELMATEVAFDTSTM